MPFVKRENDAKDAEACRRPTMRFVALKSRARLCMQSAYRYGSRWWATPRRCSIKRGPSCSSPASRSHRANTALQRRLPEVLAADANGLSERIRVLLADKLAERERLEERVAVIDREFVAEAKQSESYVRLREVPGTGAQTATALVVAVGVGDGEAFETGRDLATWLRRMVATKARRIVIVALAARLARIVWALLTSGQRFGVRSQPVSAV